MLQRFSHYFYGAALLTLPWIGVGVIHLLLGVDTGAGLQPSWLLLAVATILVAAEAIGRAGPGAAWRELWSRIPVSWRIATGLTVLAILASAVGILAVPVQQSAATVWGRFLRQFVQLAVMGFFVLWPALWTRGEYRWRWTARLLVASALIQATYGLLQGISFYHPNPLYGFLEKGFTSNPSILSGSVQLYLGDVFRDVPRLRGTACEPLYLGSFLLMALPWIALATRRPGRRALIGLTLALLLIGTWSRGAWIGFLAEAGCGLVLLLLAGRFARSTRPGSGARDLRLVVGFGGLIVIAVVALWLAPETSALRMPLERLLQSFSRQDWSNLTRLYSMEAAWRAFLGSPFVGIGWGQFAWHFPLHADPMGLQSQFDWPMVNNFPLQILCETGLLGLAVLIGSALAMGRAVLGRVRRPGARLIAVVPAVLGLTGLWVQLMTFSQYNLPHLWVGLGLLLAALRDEGYLAGEGNGK